jgi:uncharacterized protein YbaR (Trm112 family)
MKNITCCPVCKEKLLFAVDSTDCLCTSKLQQATLINNIMYTHYFCREDNVCYLLLNKLFKNDSGNLSYSFKYTDQWYISRYPEYPPIAIGKEDSSLEEVMQNYDTIIQTLELFS